MIILIFKKNSFHTFLNKDEIEKITDLLYYIFMIYIYVYINYILYVITWFLVIFISISISAKNLNKFSSIFAIILRI